MAQYLVLIYENEQSWADADEQGRSNHGEHDAFGAKNGASLRGGNALEATSTATSLRRNATGEIVATDVHSPRRKRPWVATTSSRPTTSTRHWRSPSRFRPTSAVWKCVRSGTWLNDTGDPQRTAVFAAVANAHRHEWAFVLASTMRITRDFDVAEECVQDAFAKALATWSEQGVPTNPGRG